MVTWAGLISFGTIFDDIDSGELSVNYGDLAAELMLLLPRQSGLSIQAIQIDLTKYKEMSMAQIEDIEGVGPQYAEKLRAADIASVEKLLESGATAKGRDELSVQTGISSKLILTWVNHADLFRIKGVAGQFSELLEAAGVDTVPELAQRNAENLQLALAKTNDEKHLAKTTPSLTQVTNWIAEAKNLPKVVQH
jgi:predicted flap endonuclease-1-like 5' DNA nuclease